MTVLERVDATTPGTRRTDSRSFLVATALLVPCFDGTNAGFRSTYDMGGTVSMSVTAGYALVAAPPRTNTAEEVSVARDELVRRGLTRQQIAGALGVDRRSLSGWATGEIRPTPERLVALRALVDVVSAIDAAYPGRAGEILTQQRGGSDLLGHLARGRVDLLERWEQWASRPAASVTVTRHRAEGEPVWAAAAEAKLAGRLGRLERARTVRPDSEDEMDLDEAATFAEPPIDQPRRRSYR